jgi:hypothetical protein
MHGRWRMDVTGVVVMVRVVVASIIHGNVII